MSLTNPHLSFSHSSWTAVGRTSASVSSRNSIPVLLRCSPDGIQISLNLLLPTSALLCPQCPIKLAAFNARTLIPMGQQVHVWLMHQTLAIDKYCIQEACIQGFSSHIYLTSPLPVIQYSFIFVFPGTLRLWILVFLVSMCLVRELILHCLAWSQSTARYAQWDLDIRLK